MNKLLISIKKIGSILISSLRRFPETILISTSFVVIMIMNNHANNFQNLVLIKLSYVLALGIPLSIILLLIQERMKPSVLYRIISALLLITYGSVFFRLMPIDKTQSFMIRYAFTTAIAYLLITIIQYLPSRKNYGLYIIKLATSFFVTYLYTLVLYLGVIAIIFTIDQLFNLNIKGELYFDTFITAVGVFGLTYFLGRIPMLSDNLENFTYPVVLRVLFLSIIMPLVTVYTVVLYAYLIRIIFTWQWPEGIVSHLVTWYGFISMILLIIIKPLELTSAWTKLFRKYLPIAILVPLAMLIASITIRINAYGITILRYLVVLAWVWLVTSAIYLIVAKKRPTQYIIISFIVIFIIAMVGPVNGFTVSAGSQANRLEVILEDNHMLDNGVITPIDNLDEATRSNMSSILSYLETENDFDRVSGLSKDFKMSDMQDVFGFTYYGDYYSNDDRSTYVDFSYTPSQIIDISGYDHFVQLRVYEENQFISITDNEWTLEIESDTITMIKNDRVIQTMDIAALLNENNVVIDTEFTQSEEPIILMKSYEQLNVMIILYELHGQMNGDMIEPNYYEG
ncbi:MAG: DUF4153 domain-containing protein, partial [Vallitaleaceae bacterium]|nr:DUF4153 domain-containing protein [Vallitaleaceae bacterium]